MTADWKVYTPEGVKEAETVHAESAAALVALLGDGATVRRNRTWVVWREGAEYQSAAESYDYVADVVNTRVWNVQEAPPLCTGPPENGCDRCSCGCKYWNDDGTCFDCGEEFKR